MTLIERRRGGSRGNPVHPPRCQKRSSRVAGNAVSGKGEQDSGLTPIVTRRMSGRGWSPGINERLSRVPCPKTLRKGSSVRTAARGRRNSPKTSPCTSSFNQSATHNRSWRSTTAGADDHFSKTLQLKTKMAAWFCYSVETAGKWHAAHGCGSHLISPNRIPTRHVIDHLDRGAIFVCYGELTSDC